MSHKNIIKDFNWLKRYSGYPEKCATLEPIIRKAIPMKPCLKENRITKLPIEVCPRCREFVVNNYRGEYCGCCGQAILWEE